MIDNRPTHLEQKVMEGYLLCSNIETGSTQIPGMYVEPLSMLLHQKNIQEYFFVLRI